VTGTSAIGASTPKEPSARSMIAVRDAVCTIDSNGNPNTIVPPRPAAAGF